MSLAAEKARKWRKENPEKSKVIRQRYYQNHKEESKERDKNWRAANPDKAKSKSVKENNIKLAMSSRFKRLYGISVKQYDEMLVVQRYTCFICHRPETVVMHGKVMRLSVDHDHKTGKVRKLLCFACNTALGHLEDNPDRMRQLASYIEDHYDL